MCVCVWVYSYLYVLQELLFSAADALQLLSLLWTEVIRHWGHNKHTKHSDIKYSPCPHKHTQQKHCTCTHITTYGRTKERPESPTGLSHYGNTIFDPSNYNLLPHNERMKSNPFVLNTQSETWPLDLPTIINKLEITHNKKISKLVIFFCWQTCFVWIKYVLTVSELHFWRHMLAEMPVSLLH